MFVFKDADNKAQLVMVQNKMTSSGVKISQTEMKDIVKSAVSWVNDVLSDAKRDHPLRKYGIKERNQVTFVLMAPREPTLDVEDFKEKCKDADADFRVVLMADEQVRDFFTPSLAPLAYLATSGSKTQRN